MKRTVASLAAYCLFVSLADAQDFEDWVVGGVSDGVITITNFHSEVVPLLTIDVKSASGGLKANGSGPFAITLLDTPNNVVIGNLGNSIDLPPGATVKTEISYVGPVSSLMGSWNFCLVPCELTFVPEPATRLMACFAVFALLGFRHRR